jgi:phage-related tail protein
MAASDEVDLLQRKIDALNRKMIELINSSVQDGNDIESHEAEFKEISIQSHF